MKEIKIDQSVLAEDISSKIEYEFRNLFLVKPLDPVKVKKEFSKPVAKDDTAKKDENEIEAVDYDQVETEVKEVDSDYRTGIVLKVPFDSKNRMDSKDFPEMEINVGDTVVYKDRRGAWFDLLKNTQLVGVYDIIAKAA